MRDPFRLTKCLFRGGCLILLALLAVAFASAAPAFASVAAEQQQGARALGAVHSGKLNPKALSSRQYEHVGEYLMGQALGATATHERMNKLMEQMMGSAAVDQMHIYVGKRYLGLPAGIPRRFMPMYGLAGMMTGARHNAIAGMMNGYLSAGSHTSGSYGDMTGSSPTTSSGMMGSYGTQSAANSDGGWPTGAVVATAGLAALLVGGLIAFAASALRHRGARRSPARSAETPTR